MERLLKILAICGCTMVQPGLMLVKYKGRKELQEHKELTDRKALPVQTDCKAQLAILVHKAWLVMTEHKAFKVLKAHKALPVLKEPQEHKVL